MAHIRMKIYSNCLRRYTHVTVMIPTPTENHYTPEEIDSFDGPDFFKEQPRYRVLYLLHGTHGDDTDWSYYSNVERNIIGTDLMVVCPDGNNSFWADMPDGPRQATFLTQELRQYINRLFPTRPERENTFLAGLSMGGFATLNNALNNTELYGKVCALSAGLGGSDLGVLKTRTYPWRLILPESGERKGSAIDGEAALRRALDAKKRLPGIMLTVGTEDFLYDDVQQTRRLLEQLGVPYNYLEGPGEHTFEFWSWAIPQVIEWMLDDSKS